MQEKRRVNRSLLGLHATVMEFLEVPQLIDTCVRNGNYDEALDLIAFMGKMTHPHSDVPIIQQLVRELQACSTLLLEQLLGRLSSGIALPECLRCISYLRRLSAFSEADLRQKFLQCREIWCAALRRLPWETTTPPGAVRSTAVCCSHCRRVWSVVWL